MEHKELDAGHYEGGGYSWEPGDVPMCSMCHEKVATRATAHLGVILCDDPECACAYVEEECHRIEYFEDDPCKGCDNQGFDALFGGKPGSGNDLCHACGIREE